MESQSAMLMKRSMPHPPTLRRLNYWKYIRDRRFCEYASYSMAALSRLFTLPHSIVLIATRCWLGVFANAQRSCGSERDRFGWQSLDDFDYYLPALVCSIRAFSKF